MTRFILVRHGQTEWNRVERFRGRADIALNATGLAQAESAARAIASHWQPAAIYASPMKRARQTAEAIARQASVPVEVHPGLIDIDFGLCQGLSPEQVGERWPQLLSDWYTRPGDVQFPEGEGLPQVRSRGMAAVADLAARHDGQVVVLVGHTVINRAILLGVLSADNGLFWRLGQDTCAINVFDSQDGGYTLVTLNNTCHLVPGA